jgi:hypothetical protein
MRLISFLVALALLSTTSFAQQAQLTPSPGPRPSQGYTGSNGPPGPPTPYSAGPPPEVFSATGRSIPGPDNTTVIVKAVPCAVASRWTDGTTTCVGIPDWFRKSQR